MGMVVEKACAYTRHSGKVGAQCSPKTEKHSRAVNIHHSESSVLGRVDSPILKTSSSVFKYLTLIKINMDKLKQLYNYSLKFRRKGNKILNL